MNRIPSIILIAITCSVLFFTITGEHGLTTLSGISREVELMDNKNKELQAEIDKTRENISKVKNDKFYLEKLAREELVLSRKDEIVYIFPQKEKQ